MMATEGGMKFFSEYTPLSGRLTNSAHAAYAPIHGYDASSTSSPSLKSSSQSPLPKPGGSGRESPVGGYSYGTGYGGMCGAGASVDNLKSLAQATSKIDNIKQWSISTYKCTRQAIQEKLGKSSRTVDVELEDSIEDLRDAQRRYQSVLRHARALASHFHHVLETQRLLAHEFTELVHKEKELETEFKYNAETQSVLVKNGESLLAALNFFVSSVNTLCNKTIDDTLLTIKNYEAARLQYDAYREDLELLQQSTSRGGDFQARLHDGQAAAAGHKERYEQLRQDVQVKLKFLHDNRVKVLQQQLLLFHNATAAYFTGNQTGLEKALAQFSIQPKVPTANASAAFLEG